MDELIAISTYDLGESKEDSNCPQSPPCGPPGWSGKPNKPQLQTDVMGNGVTNALKARPAVLQDGLNRPDGFPARQVGRDLIVNG
jgi:hypothetical protein